MNIGFKDNQGTPILTKFLKINLHLLALLLISTILFIAASLVFAVYTDTKDRQESVLISTQISDNINHLDSLERRMIDLHAFVPKLFNDIQEHRSAIHAYIHRLNDLNPNDNQVEQISKAFYQYEYTTDSMFEHLERRKIEEAKLIDQQQVRSDFNELSASTKTAIVTYNSLAVQKAKKSTILYFLIAVTFTFSLGLVFWFYGKFNYKVRVEDITYSQIKNIFDNSSDGICLVDTDYNLILTNNTLAKLFKTNDLTGKKCFDLFCNSQCKTDNCPLHILKNGKNFSPSILTLKIDETETICEITATPHYSYDKKLIGIVKNIKDVTAKFREQNLLMRYKLILENVRDIILFVEMDESIIEANNAATKAYGYSRDELLNLKIMDLRLDSVSFVTAQINIANEKGILFETVHKTKNGRTFPVEVSSKGTDFGDKRILVSVIRDITERKQAEKELLDQKIFTENIIQNSNIPTFVINPQHKVMIWNKACENITGISCHEVLGTDDQWKAFYSSKRPCFSDAIIDQDVEDILRNYRKTVKLDTVNSVLQAERWLELGGKRRYMMFHVAPIHDSQGNLVAAIETLQDITELKLTQEVLYETAQKLQSIIDQAAVGISQVDFEGNLFLVNQKFCEILGYSQEEVSNLNVLDFTYSEDVAITKKNLNEVINPDVSSISYEKRYVKKDGSIIWALVTIAPVRKVNGTIEYIIEIIQDIDDKKKSEEIILNQNKQMEEGLKLAAKVQNELLPKKAPSSKAVNFAWSYQPSVFVAGDMFDIFSLGENLIGFYILDVKGHGISSALNAVTLNHLLKPSYSEDISPSILLKQLNNGFALTNQTFFTILYGILDTGTFNFKFSRAGHCPPVIIPAKGDPELLYAGGPAIGMVENFNYIDYEKQLGIGDKVLLYTDGLIESANVSQDLYAGLMNNINSNKNLNISETIKLIVEKNSCTQGYEKDDLTILGFEILPR